MGLIIALHKDIQYCLCMNMTMINVLRHYGYEIRCFNKSNMIATIIDKLELDGTIEVPN